MRLSELAPALLPLARTGANLRPRGVSRLGHRQAGLPFSFVSDGRPRGDAIDLGLRLVLGRRRRMDLPIPRVERPPARRKVDFEPPASRLLHDILRQPLKPPHAADVIVLSCARRRVEGFSVHYR